MTKLVFFSLEDGWLGGVASVNMTLEDALSEKNVEVKDLFLRGCNFPRKAEAHHTVIRKDCPWEYVTGREILSSLKKLKFISAARLVGKRMQNRAFTFLDFRKAKAYLKRENPDCILVSHYLLLPAVPKHLLPRTLHHVHTSFRATESKKANVKMLRRYNEKIGFVWLSRGICEAAEKAGFQRSFYQYNPISSFPEKPTCAEESKTIGIITRFSPEKRLDKAVLLLKEAMDRLSDPNKFSVEIWGTGPEEEAIAKACGSDPRFSLRGETKTPLDVLSRCRFTVNTSAYEGFSISVLEAAAAGVPTVSFRFGEAAEEEIVNGKTGLLVNMDDDGAFVEDLVSLMENDDLVKKLSQNAREHAKKFSREEIASSWCSLLSQLPLDKKGKA